MRTFAATLTLFHGLVAAISRVSPRGNTYTPDAMSRLHRMFDVNCEIRENGQRVNCITSEPYTPVHRQPVSPMSNLEEVCVNAGGCDDCEIGEWGVRTTEFFCRVPESKGEAMCHLG
ncbi:hypothetical protein ACCO45_007469 [Purpureocillium lilacinum]|uniref:Uncharacterized protein n=1 Tax=Purpureocillium lilacinum TaxID=33203 RepID=A0ACC4DT95_PURLI